MIESIFTNSSYYLVGEPDKKFIPIDCKLKNIDIIDFNTQKFIKTISQIVIVGQYIDSKEIFDCLPSEMRN